MRLTDQKNPDRAQHLSKHAKKEDNSPAASVSKGSIPESQDKTGYAIEKGLPAKYIGNLALNGGDFAEAW